MPHESGKEHGRSYGQERPHCRNAHHHPDSEVRTGNVLAAKAISDQEVEDNHIEQAREQAWRVGIEANGPIQMHRQRVRDEPSDEDERQNDPVATETVKENVAGGDSREERSVKTRRTSARDTSARSCRRPI